MSDKREKQLFNKLIKAYGFYIEEYGRSEQGDPLHAAIKYSDKGVIGVIVTNNSREEENVKKFTAFLYAKNQPAAIYAVVYGDYFHEAYGESINYNRVLVENHGNKVISYTPSSEFIVNQLQGNDLGPRRALRKKSKVTLAIIAINLVVYLITAFYSDSIFDINNYVLYLFGAKENTAIANGQYYRLLTAAFLHGGLTHIALNMYSLYIIGDIIEQVYGRVKYIAIYLIAAIFSSLLSYKFSPYMSIGASGAIFGLMGAALIFAYKERSKIGRDFLRNILSVIGINIFIGLSLSNIDNFGHIGGLLGGIITGMLLYPKDY